MIDNILVRGAKVHNLKNIDGVVFVNAGAQELGEGSSDCFLPAADENRFSQFGLSQVCRLAENRSRVVLLSLEHNALEMCFSQYWHSYA